MRKKDRPEAEGDRTTAIIWACAGLSVFFVVVAFVTPTIAP